MASACSHRSSQSVTRRDCNVWPLPLLYPCTTTLLSNHIVTCVTPWPMALMASSALMTAVISALGTIYLPAMVPYSP
eukprot:8537491-Karenia_brevis.AAC.1